MILFSQVADFSLIDFFSRKEPVSSVGEPQAIINFPEDIPNIEGVLASVIFVTHAGGLSRLA